MDFKSFFLLSFFSFPILNSMGAYSILRGQNNNAPNYDSKKFDIVKDGLMFSFNPDSTSVSLNFIDSNLIGRVCIPSRVENQEGVSFIVSAIGSYDNVPVLTTANVNEIIISEGIKTIRSYSFADCKNLQTVMIPASVKIIDDHAFYGCSKLTNITIEGQTIIKSRTSFYNTEWMNNQSKKGPLVLAGNLLWYNGSFPRDYVIPEGVFNICSDAFQNGLFNNIVVSEGVKYIQPNAFYATKTIKLPLSLESLALNIYTNPDSDSQIDSLFIPKNVCELILENSSNNYEFLKFRKISVDHENKTFCSPHNSNVIIRNSDSTLIIAGNENPIIPQGVKNIGAHSFEFHDILTIIVPNSVVSVYEYAFHGCLKLKKVVLPETVKYIGDNAFRSCRKLTDFSWPDQLRYIGSNAFFATGLKCVSLPKFIEIIGSNAFAASSLETIIFSDSLKYIGHYAFSNTKISELELPSGISRIEAGTFSNCSSLKSIIIPNNIEEIGKYAFSGCQLLESVIIMDGVKIINEYAFEGSNNLYDIYLYSIKPPYVFDNSFSIYKKLHINKKLKRSYSLSDTWKQFKVTADLK